MQQQHMLVNHHSDAPKTAQTMPKKIQLAPRSPATGLACGNTQQQAGTLIMAHATCSVLMVGRNHSAGVRDSPHDVKTHEGLHARHLAPHKAHVVALAVLGQQKRT
jgi:hypothetical protein